MMKQFAEIKIYELGGGVAFEEVSESVPFLVLPKGQSTIKSWGTSGFLFENIVTGDVIAFVAEYDDVLDSTGTAYGVDQLAVFAALGGFFFDLGGGGGAADLATVLGLGNTSGANDIDFDASQGLMFDNSSRLREGTIDAGLGGNKGIAQICGAGYELKWEAGRLYVMGSSGNTIRWSLYNFNVTPDVNDDDTKGYSMGSLWSLDSGAVYLCGDATTGAAVWTLQSNAVPTLSQVLASGKSAGNSEITDLDKLDFNTSPAGTAGEGQLVWNDTLGTVNLGLKGGNTISNLGQHLHARVVNKTTPLVALTKAGYEVVIVAGATGQRLSVKLAKADNDANSAGTLGVVCENIAVNQEGFICSVGQLTNINTTGSLQGETWNDGDSLYLSPTTFGAITNVKPSAPFHEVRIGYVEYSHAINGKIYVKIDNGYELDELHNVSINSGTLANRDILQYNSSSLVWENKKQPIEIQLAASDETTALTTGTAKVTFRLPVAFTLTEVRASLTTAQASGSIFTVDINQSGSSVLGTKLTIDNTEKTSTTAATPATITTSALTDDAEITVDIDQIGNGTATGLKITLIGTR
jgi:hypothetical protein